MRPKKVSDREILIVLEPTADPSTLRAFTTGGVSQHIDLGIDQTRNRLTDLVADGYAGRERFPDTFIWWITPEGVAHLDELEE